MMVQTLIQLLQRQVFCGCRPKTVEQLLSSAEVVKRVSKVLPEPDGPLGGAYLHSLSPKPETSLHCKTTHMGLVYRTVYPFTPQLLLVLTASTQGGTARLSWPRWLVTYRDGLPVGRWSPIQVLTGPNIRVTSLIETNLLPLLIEKQSLVTAITRTANS